MLAAAYPSLPATKAVLHFAATANPASPPPTKSSPHALFVRRLQIEALSLMVPAVIVCVVSVLRGISLVSGIGEQDPPGHEKPVICTS